MASAIARFDASGWSAICAAHNLPFDLVTVSLESREDALRWIINNQLGRRNLDELEKSRLRGVRFNLEKHSHGGDRRSEELEYPRIVSTDLDV